MSAASRVLVIGGSGRVGGSTVRALHKYYAGSPEALGRPAGAKLELLVGGRKRAKFDSSIKRWRTLEPAESYEDINFVPLDLTNHASLVAAMTGCDLVVHTAGPFQGKDSAEVLAAALEAGAHYVDVCDDAKVARSAKALEPQARSAGLSATISAGIWPGVDQLMALNCCTLLGGASNVDSVDFSAFTAGTGNAGTTILSATFLILAEQALSYRNGKPVYFPAASDFKKVNFGQVLGDRTVFRMNIIEAVSCHEVLGVPNIDTYFGTAPEGWNYLLKAMTLLPQWLLRDRDLMQALAVFSEPVVRLTDMLVGSANAMRVTATAKDGSTAVMTYAHNDLEECVGIATAAFAAAALRGDIKTGIWYPEEALRDEAARKRLLAEATRGAFLWEQHVTPGLKDK